MINKGQVIEVVDTYDVDFHIQRIGCQPEQLLYPVANPARAPLIREKKEIGKTGSPPPPPPPRALLVRRKQTENHATHLHA